MLSLQVVATYLNSWADINRECVAQGVANIACGFLHSLGGDTLIGQTLMNVKSGALSFVSWTSFIFAGARGRLSSFVAAIGLFIIIVAAGPLIELIPVGALIGVMFDVCIFKAFDWSALILIYRCFRTRTTIAISNAFNLVRSEEFATILTLLGRRRCDHGRSEPRRRRRRWHAPRLFLLLVGVIKKAQR